jgi:hypothetical protein
MVGGTVANTDSNLWPVYSRASLLCRDGGNLLH